MIIKFTIVSYPLSAIKPDFQAFVVFTHEITHDFMGQRIKSGYFKFVAYNSKGQEIVTGFSFVGEVVSDFVRGFLFGQTCLTTIVAGCDAEILLVTIDELRSYLQERNPGFIAHSSSILLQEAYQRYLDVLVKSPAERYRELVSRYPNLIGLLSVQEMASFLGVSRRQFHRIRETETEKAD